MLEIEEVLFRCIHLCMRLVTDITFWCVNQRKEAYTYLLLQATRVLKQHGLGPRKVVRNFIYLYIKMFRDFPLMDWLMHPKQNAGYLRNFEPNIREKFEQNLRLMPVPGYTRRITEAIYEGKVSI